MSMSVERDLGVKLEAALFCFFILKLLPIEQMDIFIFLD